MANRWLNQFYYSFHKKPVQLDCKFTVSAADAGGLGITGLSGGGIASVYMHSSLSFSGDTHTNTTIDGIASTAGLAVGMLVSGAGIPADTRIASIIDGVSITISRAATASATVTITYAAVGSINPAAGYIYVKLQDNYSQYYLGGYQCVSPLTGSAINISGSAVLTAKTPYVITSVGTSTAANWQAVGVPAGITPVVGLVFFASVTGLGTGTGQVKAVGKSGIGAIELCGSGTLSISSPIAAIVGGVSQASYLIFQCLSATSSSVTTVIPTAPADGTQIQMKFLLSSSSITVQGD